MKRAARTATDRSRSSGTGPRKTLYDLPPLELECMKALWALGEASVREIRDELTRARRLFAYTTIETIMDRLARKGAVERRKLGRAHRYTPVYQKTEAREQAVTAVVEHFFDGSRRALAAHLSGAAPSAEPRPRPAPPAPRPRATPTAPAEAAEPLEAPIDTSLL
jgi:predicted transcriptional regulator